MKFQALLSLKNSNEKQNLFQNVTSYSFELHFKVNSNTPRLYSQ